MSEYTCQARIGRGAFSDVYMAVRNEDGYSVALKQFRARHHYQKSLVFKTFENEVEILKKLTSSATAKHRLVLMISCFDTSNASTDDEQPWITFPLAKKSLREFLRANASIQIASKASICEQLIRAARCLSALMIVHRDLKPENILLFIGDDDVNFILKICDFGLAIHCESKDSHAKTCCGSPMYMAPELFMQSSSENGYKAFPIDVWSVGCIVYEVIHGYHAFEGNTLGALMSNIRRGNHRPIRPTIHFLFQRLLTQCFTVNPAKRATIESVRIPLLCKGLTGKSGKS